MKQIRVQSYCYGVLWCVSFVLLLSVLVSCASDRSYRPNSPEDHTQHFFKNLFADPFRN